jgi:1-acyl-sn-glycerol-3-phosphate acyltransferase
MLLQTANMPAVEAEKESNDLPERRKAARALQAFNRFFARVYHRLEVLSPPHLPEKGAAILICNHTSGLDPQLIQSVCPRLIRWMMAAEYYDIWGVRQIFRTVGVIPVTRSGRDTTATRAALRALHNGQILGVFPEGRIEPTDELLPFQTGVAMMAMKTSVPVYPACLDGSQRGMEMIPALLRRQEAAIAFGPEVKIDRAHDGKDGLESATQAMTRAVERLRQFARNTRQSKPL